jgi:Domain of unknown function (DUF4279)
MASSSRSARTSTVPHPLGGRSGRDLFRGGDVPQNRRARNVGLGHTAWVRTLATFRLAGPRAGTAAAVTDRLGISPTSSHEIGDQVGHLGGTRTQSMWTLRSAASPQDKVELADQLRRLLTVLEPVTASLWDLVAGGYMANWFCYLGSGSTEHDAELDRDVLHRLLALPGDLWIDAYPEDDD